MKKRTRKWWLWLGGVALLLCLICVLPAVWVSRPKPGVTWENIAKIQIGMSESDVEYLLGGPGETIGNLERAKSWQNDNPMEGSVVVRFGLDWTVRDLRWNPPPGAFLPRWRRWIFGEP